MDFKHPDLYLIAKKVNLKDPTFKVNFSFNYVYAPGISRGAVNFLYFLLSCFLFASFIFTLYQLHQKKIIEVYIPKPLRILCFKGYKSQAEKDEEKRLRDLLMEEEKLKQINQRMAYKPSIRGFDVDDSFFEEYEGGPRKGKTRLTRKVKVIKEKVEKEPPKKKPKGSDSSSSNS